MITDAGVVRGGERALTALFALGLMATVTAAAVGPPSAIFAVSLAAVGLAFTAYVVGKPVAGLATMILLAVGLSGYNDTTQIGEMLFALYFVVFLAVWYGRAFLSPSRQEPMQSSAWTSLLFLFAGGGLLGGVGLGLISGARLSMLVGETQSFATLLLILPVRAVCAQERGGAAAVALSLAAVGVVATGSNVYTTWMAFASADQLWNIIDVRAAYGETTLTASLMLVLALAMTARTRWGRLGLIVLVAIAMVGFILTKSRGFWAASVVGLAAFGWVLRRGERSQLVKTGGIVLIGGAALSVVAFRDYVYLLAVGIAKRFLTLGSASTTDRSLINRFYESAAVWDRIQDNPVAGYGFGVPFSRYDIIYSGTIDWSFVHNGYLGTWYKIGLWGLVLLLTVWVGGIVRAARAARALSLSRRERALAAGAVGTLIALAIAANTSNPFLLADQALVVAVLLGMAHGLADRATRPSAVAGAAT